MTEPRSDGENAASRETARVRREHEEIRAVLRRLGESPDLAAVEPLLDELRTLLVRDFDLEEAPDGLFQAIRQKAPHHSGKLDQLVEEHGQMLHSLGGLLERTRACLGGPVAEIHRDVARLKAKLEEHEGLETELFTDSICTDIGGHG